MSRTCESCKWSRKRGDGGLECRRHPPVRTFENGVGHWEFPSVLPLDYCGDHDAEPAAKAEPESVDPQPTGGTGKLTWKQDPAGTWTAKSQVSHRLYMIKYKPNASYEVSACGDVYGTTSWTLSGAQEWCQGIEDNALKLSRQSPPANDQPVAYAIECAPGDPKLHSLSFWKGDLQKIVTAHGGKVIPLYRK